MGWLKYRSANNCFQGLHVLTVQITLPVSVQDLRDLSMSYKELI